MFHDWFCFCFNFYYCVLILMFNFIVPDDGVKIPPKRCKGMFGIKVLAIAFLFIIS